MTTQAPLAETVGRHFLRRYQIQARKGLFIAAHVDPIAHCALGMCEESGEVAGLVKKSQYDPPRMYDPLNLLLETGDLLWYATNMLDLHGYSLQQAFVANVHKLEQRHPVRGAYSVEALLYPFAAEGETE